MEVDGGHEDAESEENEGDVEGESEVEASTDFMRSHYPWKLTQALLSYHKFKPGAFQLITICLNCQAKDSQITLISIHMN